MQVRGGELAHWRDATLEDHRADTGDEGRRATQDAYPHGVAVVAHRVDDDAIAASERTLHFGDLACVQPSSARTQRLGRPEQVDPIARCGDHAPRWLDLLKCAHVQLEHAHVCAGKAQN